MKKKPKKLISRTKTRNGEFVRLKEVVREQAAELKMKNGQLRNGREKQIRSDEQAHIRVKAMEAAVDGIFIIDSRKRDLPIIYANRSFLKMTGFLRREILDRNYFISFGAGADQRVVDEIKHTIREGKSFHGEMLTLKRSGKKCWNSLRLTPVRDPGGLVTHFVGIQTDVTLMREKELEIGEQRDELLHVTRVGKLAEFVSSLAHEISQPLTAILSYAQAAQRMFAGGDPELQRILSYIIDDDHRASAVIQRLRALLKKSSPAMKPLNINAVIRETVALIATDATVRNTVIKTEFAAHLPFVSGDRIQLQQVLLNLISNSFDALENSKYAREMVIRTVLKDAGTILVEVKDSGYGIPASNMPKLFSHFFTSKPDGLGMGLSISRSIIESHGGKMGVRNNPVRGVTFYFTLPIQKKDA